MIRTQIQLTESQLKKLRQASSASGRSIADLVREGVELYLATRSAPSREERVRRAVAVAGRFSSGSSDVSSNHDRYLSEAFKG